MSDEVKETNPNIEGQKGCFPPGTQISTPTGDRNIEDICEGDLVYAFAIDGSISEGVVTKTFAHHENDNDNSVIIITHANGFIAVTGNHWILTDNNRFIEAQDLIPGDILVDEAGVHNIITGVEQYEDVPEYVYNLTVEPHHTFIADGIRVHNKGGGKGGSSRAPVEDPNTLQSRQMAKIVEVISEGEITEISNVFFDDTPIDQFARAEYIVRTGLPDQDYIPGFDDVEAETVVSTEVTYSTPVVRQVSTTGIDAVRVTIGLNGLSYQDTSTGDLKGTSVKYAIDSKPDGGSWTTIHNVTLSGKTTSTYERSYRIQSPDGGATAWSVRVRRLTADSTKATLNNATFFNRLTEIQEIKLSYNDTAVVGLTVDAETVGGRIPRRSYQVKGIKVKVPNNYDVTTREYTGTWNGNFRANKKFCNNPAWIVYDLLTNERYGMGIPETYIDRYSFYNAAVYNDVIISDGDGGLEPRFQFDGLINTREDAWNVIQSVAAVCRSVVMEGGGVIQMVQDRPQDAIALVTNANVIDGMFDYMSSAQRARHTAANITFNDKNDRYYTRTIVEKHDAGIARYGYNPIDVVSYGTVTEGQARRFGKWLLDTENTSTDIVSWRSFLNQSALIPGNVVKIMDNEYTDIALSGRLAGVASASSFTLDRPVVLQSGKQYHMSVTLPDGTVEEKVVTTSAGTHTTINTGTFSDTPLVGADFMIYGPVQPRLFRILNVREDDSQPGVFEFSAAYYDPDKYARVEYGIVNESPVFTNPLGDGVVYPATNLVGVEESYYSNGIKRLRLRLEWTASVTTQLLYYKIQYSRDDLPYEEKVVKINNYTIDNILPGNYHIIVTAVDIRGISSVPASVDVEVGLVGGENSTLHPPINIELEEGGTVFTGTDITIKWDHNELNAGEPDTLVGYQVNVFGGGEDETVVRVIHDLDELTTSTTYYFDQNTNDNSGVPQRNVYMTVQSVDAYGRLSLQSSPVLFTNPKPEAPIVNTSNFFDSVLVKLTNIAGDRDYRGTLLCRGTTGDFVPSANNLIMDGADVSFTDDDVNEGTTYYYKAACYDDFDIAAIVNYDTLNWSGSSSGAALVPETFNDISVANLVFSTSGNTVSWTAGNATKIENEVTTSMSISAGSANWTSGTLYIYFTWGDSTLNTTTSVVTATNNKYKRLIASYKGGASLVVNTGGHIIDGSLIAAGTVAAAQLSSGTLITNSAQIGSGVIENANIKNATVGALQLVEGDITKTWYGKTNNTSQASVQVDAGITGEVSVLTPQSGTIMSFTVPELDGIPTGTPLNGFIFVSYYYKITFPTGMAGSASLDYQITSVENGTSYNVFDTSRQTVSGTFLEGYMTMGKGWQLRTGDSVTLKYSANNAIIGNYTGTTTGGTVSAKLGKGSIFLILRMR